MADLLERLQSGLADRYRLARELGRGGMATVYLAQDLRHDRSVALKVLHPELAATVGPERFQREIETVARLQHPHILTVHDSGATAGQLWFTMPFVEGESLRDRLRREPQLPVEVALRIVTDAARALQYAHDHGVIHRDIKPENLLLTTDGSTLVADFGIARALSADDARLTETGLSVGTPTYMSPEQAAGDRHLDARTDVYALGTVLYEMLAGEPPFTGATAQTVIAKRFSGEVPRVRLLRPAVPEAVERAVTRALAPVAADRFATAAEFARALQPTAATPTVAEFAQALTGATPVGGWPRRWAASQRPRLTQALTLAGVFLFVALAGYALLARRTPAPEGRASFHQPGPRDGATSDAAGSSPPPSIAVLPFVNLSPDHGDEYFSDGMTEELINALGKVEGLRVAARTSAFAFKGKSEDVNEIGRKLRVGTVLEGSVRRAGPKLRIAARLVSARDGYDLWSETYDRKLSDVFAVQEDIARAIVGALKGRLLGQAGPKLVRPPTTGIAAYDEYLKGRFSLATRNREGLDAAVRHFRRAIATDPTAARAYAGLADAYSLLISYGDVSGRAGLPQAKAAALRALALDTGLADAHASLAAILSYERDGPGSEREFQRAIALNPSYAEAHHWYADFLADRGLLDQCLAEYRRAEALDPLSPIISVGVAWTLYFQRRYDDASDQLAKAFQLDTTFQVTYVVLGIVRLQQHRGAAAVAALRQAVELSHGSPTYLAALGYAYAFSGARDSAGVVLAALRAQSAAEYVPASAFALLYTGLGDRERAMNWLAKSVAAQEGWYFSDVDPLWDPLRADPRFSRLLKQEGFP